MTLFFHFEWERRRNWLSCEALNCCPNEVINTYEKWPKAQKLEIHIIILQCIRWINPYFRLIFFNVLRKETKQNTKKANNSKYDSFRYFFVIFFCLNLFSFSFILIKSIKYHFFFQQGYAPFLSIICANLVIMPIFSAKCSL